MTADILPMTVGKKSSPLYKSLFVQVLVALLVGIVLGMYAPAFSVQLKVLSDGFLKLISMIVAPIVFCVVVHGIAGAGDLKKVGRVGVKALIYFEVMTTIALALGLILAGTLGNLYDRIIFTGVRVTRDTALQLMDTMPDDRLVSQIRAVAATVPGVLGVEKCFARKTGLRWRCTRIA